MTSKTLGILGCGQLAQMLARSAKKLNLSVCFLQINEIPVVEGFGEIFDESQLDEFLTRVDYVTVEREDIPEAILKAVSENSSLSPCFDALLALRSRHSQKALFDTLNIPTSPWCMVERLEDLEASLEKCPGERVRAKQVLGGYDGGGQWSLSKTGDNPDIPANRFPIIIESELHIDGEISVLMARSSSGEIQCYPVSYNYMQNGVLTWSLTPAQLDEDKISEAKSYAESLMHHINYAGIMAMEFFICDGKLLVNEIAPRVHNTGHWTIDGCDCDQFEQHVRATTEMELREPGLVGAAAMCNILGDTWVSQKLPDNPVRMYLHGYGKQFRPGRKMGHVTLIGPDYNSVYKAAQSFGLR